MRKQFEVSLVIAANEVVTADQLKEAMSYLMRKAVQCSPDCRFDWMDVGMNVQEYVDNPPRKN